MEARKGLFRPANDIQRKLGRVAVVCDAAHALGARVFGKAAEGAAGSEAGLDAGAGCSKGECGSGYAGSGHLYLVRLLGRTREETNKVIEEMAACGIACNVH